MTTCPAARPGWPLERVLFALAGTMTLQMVPQPMESRALVAWLHAGRARVRPDRAQPL